MAKLVKKVKITGDLISDPYFAAKNGISPIQKPFELNVLFSGSFYSGHFIMDKTDYYVLGQEKEVRGFLFLIFNKDGNNFSMTFNEGKENFNLRFFESKKDSKNVVEKLICLSNADIEVSDVDTSELRDDTIRRLAFSPTYGKKFNEFFEASMSLLFDKEGLNYVYDLLSNDNLIKDYKRIDKEHPIDLIPLSKKIQEKIIDRYLKTHDLKHNTDLIISRKEADEIFNKIAEELVSLDIDFSQVSYNCLTNILEDVVLECIPIGGSVALHYAKRMYQKPYLQHFINETPEKIVANEIIDVCGEKYNDLLRNVSDCLKKYNNGKFSEEELLENLLIEYKYNQVGLLLAISHVIMYMSLDDSLKKIARNIIPKISEECVKELELREFSSECSKNDNMIIV